MNAIILAAYYIDTYTNPKQKSVTFNDRNNIRIHYIPTIYNLHAYITLVKQTSKLLSFYGKHQ